MNDLCLFYYRFFKENLKKGYAATIKPVILIPPFFGKELYLKEIVIHPLKGELFTLYRKKNNLRFSLDQ